MKAAVLAVLFLSGCMTMATPVSRLRDPAPIPAAPVIPERDEHGAVRIVPKMENAGSLFMTVSMRAQAEGLEPPVVFRWNLGNGRQWDGPEPPPQTYITGRYDVILTGTDAHGRVRSASMKVDAENHGCGH